MARANEIVEINITRESRGVSRQGFGKPLFIGQKGFNDDARVRSYTGISQVEEDFVDGDPELTAARQFFGQQVRPAEIKIGYHDPLSVASVTYEVDSPVTATTYEITINGTEVSYTSFGDDAIRDVINGLELDFASKITNARFVKSETSFRVIPDNPNDFTYSTTSTELTEQENLETYVDAYSYIKFVDSDFYYVTMDSHDVVDVEGMADVVQAEKRIFVTSTSDRKAPNPLYTGDIGSTLQAKDLTRTFIIYAENDLEYPECAIVGLQAAKAPGSATWKFRTVSGVTVSRLSTTESLSLKGTRFDYGKGYNTYELIGGRNIFAEGRAVNGEFIDIIIFSDWIEARMRERIFQALVNKDKLPYSNSGLAIIEGHIRSVLNEGVAVGGLSTYTIDMPDVRNLSANLRANRVVEGIQFEATLVGSVHFVSIRGNLII